jgi:hypothetical protein
MKEKFKKKSMSLDLFIQISIDSYETKRSIGILHAVFDNMLQMDFVKKDPYN